MSSTIELHKPTTFANADLRILESEAPDKCPLCGWPVIKGIYDCECSNFDDCEWIAEYKEEESKPIRYDYMEGVIIK